MLTSEFNFQAFINADNESFEQELRDALQKEEEKSTHKENLPPESPQVDLTDPFETTEPKMGYTSQDVEMHDRGRPVDRLTSVGTVSEPAAHRGASVPEMQEKRGPGLIASSRHRGPTSSSGPMELIREEEGSDEETEAGNIGFGK